MCTPVPTTESTKPKVRSVPTTCAAVSEVSPNSATVPSAPAPEEENPTSAAMGKVSSPIQPVTIHLWTDNRVGRKWRMICQPEVKMIMPPRTIYSGFLGPCAATWWKSSEPAITPGTPPTSIPPKDAEGNLLAQNLHRDHDYFDDGGKRQRRAHGNLHRNMEKKYQERGCYHARPNTGERDYQGYAEPYCNLEHEYSLLFRLHVDTAFLFAPAPSA